LLAQCQSTKMALIDTFSAFIGNSVIASTIASGFLLYALWGLWSFVVVPAIWPHIPKHLPYWAPFLGHALQFASDSEKVFHQGRKYFGRRSPPYSIQLAGKTFYVLTEPKDFVEIYRNGSIFSFDFLVDQVYRAFLVPDDAINKLCRTPEPGEKTPYPNPLGKSCVNIGHEMLITELRGKQSYDFAEKVKSTVAEMMDLDKICSRFAAPKSGKGNALEVSLFDLCGVMVISAGQTAYFGKELSEIDLHLPEAFMEFDKLCWQMFYGYPLFLSKPMTRSKGQLLRAMEKFLDIPAEKRPGMSWFVRNWEAVNRYAGLNSREIATIMLIQYFGLNTNTPKGSFWLLSHILFNPKLAKVIRDETEAAFKAEIFDYSLIESSKKLDSLWLETLRWSSSSVSFRYVTENFTLNGLELQKGNQVMLNPRLFHQDPEYFGSDVANFDPDRFLDNPNYGRSVAFRPFGGGEPLCPGRQIAKQTAITFVAYVLHRFDIELVGAQTFPRPSQQGNPGVGIMAPLPGDDLRVRLTKRDS